ncbi:flagellin [Halobacillus yeomjeoni]|uniref:flagellin N-terminal helical domain-containing protein n=1 Tax=Halobacillus yeomjeoni TaxID=311194 RepID=UPI001CD4071F|nr:flagellin [Halobacillus yeomjeoni]MCA0984672.1 flagellin [Halobacillus yeomjeoni]
MRINHNIAALNTYRQLGQANNAMGNSMEKLSSGLRINKAGDDAAGLAISEKMRGQIRGLDQAQRNSQDSISLIQTAEGALNETHSILQRMRELAVQSSNDTATATDRNEIQKEVDQLAQEITRISNTTEFNTKNLLAGGHNSKFHIGANADQNIQMQIGSMDAYSLGVAGQTVNADSFSGGTSGISGITELGRGFATGTGYNIDVSKTDAAYSTALQDQSVTGTKNVASSDVAINPATNYTGTTDKTFQVKVTAESGNNVSTIEYSTDGGSNWNSVSGVKGATDTSFNLGDGLSLTINDGTAAGDYVVNDTYTFAVTAAYADLQLQDSGSTDIGSATRVYNGDTSAQVGNLATGETLKSNFAFGSLTDAQSATFNLTANTSSAATTDANGNVSVNAVAQAGIAVNTQSSANSAITSINNAIENVSAERSKLGAYQNRLDHTINNLGTSSENLTAAESRIRDVDMAKEMMNQTKQSILAQASQAMLAKANQNPQGVLQLLR